MKNILAKNWRLYRDQIKSGERKSISDLINDEQKSFGFLSGSGDILGDLAIDLVIEKLRQPEQNHEGKDAIMNINKERHIFKEANPDKDERLFELGMEFLEAARCCDEETIKVFIDAGYPVNFQKPSNGMTALHYAAARPCGREVVRVLVNSGKCDYLLPDGWGWYAHSLSDVGSSDLGITRLLYKKANEQAKKQGLSGVNDLPPYGPRPSNPVHFLRSRSLAAEDLKRKSPEFIAEWGIK